MSPIPSPYSHNSPPKVYNSSLKWNDFQNIMQTSFGELKAILSDLTFFGHFTFSLLWSVFKLFKLGLLPMQVAPLGLPQKLNQGLRGANLRAPLKSPVHLFQLCAGGSTDLGFYLWGIWPLPTVQGLPPSVDGGCAPRGGWVRPPLQQVHPPGGALFTVPELWVSLWDQDTAAWCPPTTQGQWKVPPLVGGPADALTHRGGHTHRPQPQWQEGLFPLVQLALLLVDEKLAKRGYP